MVKITVWGVSVIYSCVRGETENAFWRDQNSLFLLVCPRRIFDNQRFTKTENGSDLTLYAPSLFVFHLSSMTGAENFSGSFHCQIPSCT